MKRATFRVGVASALLLSCLLGVLNWTGVTAGMWQSEIHATMKGSITIPFGVADPGGFAFVANDRGGIDAIDLESGSLYWRSDAARTPLALGSDRLYAIAEKPTPHFVSMSVRDGRKVADLPPPPAWAEGMKHPGAWHVARAAVVGEQLHVEWRAQHARWANGFPPPRDVEEELNRVYKAYGTLDWTEWREDPAPPKDLDVEPWGPESIGAKVYDFKTEFSRRGVRLIVGHPGGRSSIWEKWVEAPPPNEPPRPQVR
ncbi:MAG TPA: hypothetical protein VFF73_20445 [Planctomycetota bacterium]|nr:hypothetical protein [Planctomycetota bacterium]